MSVPGTVRRVLRFVPLLCGFCANGCLAAVERNLDYILAPDALENTLRVPLCDVGAFAQFLFRFIV